MLLRYLATFFGATLPNKEGELILGILAYLVALTLLIAAAVIASSAKEFGTVFLVSITVNLPPTSLLVWVGGLIARRKRRST